MTSISSSHIILDNRSMKAENFRLSPTFGYKSIDLNSTLQGMLLVKFGGGLNLIECQFVELNYSKCLVVTGSLS